MQRSEKEPSGTPLWKEQAVRKKLKRELLTKGVQEFGRASEGVPAQEETASGRRGRGQLSSDSRV